MEVIYVLIKIYDMKNNYLDLLCIIINPYNKQTTSILINIILTNIKNLKILKIQYQI